MLFSSDEIQEDKKSTATGRSGISKRLKFAFTEPQLRSAINRIRDLTQDYNTLISRICSDHERRQPDTASGTSLSKKVARFALVKKVAENLYSALSSACTKHTEHQAHFCVQPGWNSPRAQLSFRIAFRKPSSITAVVQEQLTWITINSSFAPKLSIPSPKSVQALTELNHALRRFSASPPCQTPRKRLKKIVKFQSPTPPSPLTAQVIEHETPLQSLNADKNLCNQLQKAQASAKTGLCVGFLHHSAESKHLIYLDKQRMSMPNGAYGSPLVSLQELLAKLQQDRERRATLTSLERICFARKLATAVLHLHETPWLKSSWRSRDVYLSDIASANGRTLVDLNEPFLSVAVKQSQKRSSPAPTPPNRTLIRNAVLFGLGVIFLELAYEAPLHVLEKPEDVDEREARNTEYYVADRVRIAASRLLGGRYAEVTRKCIQCDFGRGSDLNDAKLQEVFHREVIEELEELEVKLRAVDVGD